MGYENGSGETNEVVPCHLQILEFGRDIVLKKAMTIIMILPHSIWEEG